MTATGFVFLFYIYASNASRVTYQLINDAVVGNRCIHIVCSCTDFMCFLLTNVAVPPRPCVTSWVFSCLLCFHLGRDSSFPILVFLIFVSLFLSTMANLFHSIPVWLDFTAHASSLMSHSNNLDTWYG